MIENFQRAKEFGIDLEGSFRPNMERIMARKNEVIRTHRPGDQKNIGQLQDPI